MKDQGLCETTLTERFHFDECVCGTYPDNLGPCRTYLPGANKRCVYCDHKLQCHTALDERINNEIDEIARQIVLFDQGKSPLPPGVIACSRKKRKRKN